MNIAQVVVTFPPEYTGIGNVCYNNSIELSKLGNNVSVFTTRAKVNNNTKFSFEVIRLNPLLRFGNASILHELLNINNADIIHLHLPFFLDLNLYI